MRPAVSAATCSNFHSASGVAVVTASTTGRVKGGVRVEGAREMKRSGPIEPSHVVIGTGKVAWSRKQGEREFFAGIQFENLSPDQTTYLQQLVTATAGVMNAILDIADCALRRTAKDDRDQLER